MTGDGHAGKTYELGGPASMSALAQVVPQESGRTVTCTDLSVEQYTQVLVGAGLPGPVATVYADGDRGLANGELLVEGDDLQRLLGRPATPPSLSCAAEASARGPACHPVAMDYRLALVVLPVSDIDRAQAVHEAAGFAVDVDHRAGEDFRVGQRRRAGRTAP